MMSFGDLLAVAYCGGGEEWGVEGGGRGGCPWAHDLGGAKLCQGFFLLINVFKRIIINISCR